MFYINPVGGWLAWSGGSAVSVLSVKVELFQSRGAADLKLSNGLYVKHYQNCIIQYNIMLT